MEDSEVIKSICGQVSLGIKRNDLTPNQTKVLKLINSCLSKCILLDEYILQDWFMEEIVKPRKRIVKGKYLGYRDEKGYAVFERIPEYDFLKREIEKRGLLQSYYLSEPKQNLKRSIGALVVKGYLTVIPNINLSKIQEIDSK